MSDSNVVFITTPKDPRSVEDFNWDFRPLLKVGDAISSIAKMFIERGDSALTFGTPAPDDNNVIVSSRLSGGRRGVRYRVTILIVTVTGEEIDLSLEFDCR